MTTKRSFYVLCIIYALLTGIYSLYFIPEKYYIGYYPIGIVQIFLVGGSLVTLILHVRYCILISKKVGIRDVLIFVLYIISILFMMYSLLVWIAFFP